jgi:hypothetical protein
MEFALLLPITATAFVAGPLELSGLEEAGLTCRTIKVILLLQSMVRKKSFLRGHSVPVARHQHLPYDPGILVRYSDRRFVHPSGLLLLQDPLTSLVSLPLSISDDRASSVDEERSYVNVSSLTNSLERCLATCRILFRY